MTQLNRFIVIDLETTGNQPDKDTIIQVGAVLIEDDKIKQTYSSFVYTDKLIPSYIQDLTGINEDMLKNAPKIDEVMQKLLSLLEGSVFVAHNAPFDLAFIQNALDQLGYLPFSGLVIDTLDMSRILLPMVQSYKLDSMTQELEIIHEQPHRADADAYATATILLQLFNRLKEMPLAYLQRLQELIKNTHHDLYLIVEEMTHQKICFYSEDEHYELINQIALKKEEIDNSRIPTEKSTKLSFDLIFEKNGLLSERFPDFEIRPAQEQMALEVMNAFEEGYHLMVEAGTGTGKSLAYLIPAIFWAKQHEEKIVIVTHTINLQEQLYQRDIPLLKKTLPFDFKATILKGRNNYLCLRKFELQLNQFPYEEPNKEQSVNLSQMLTWVAQTETGDVEEINLSLSGRDLWQQVKSDADSCLNRSCPWFRQCFYHKAKQKAQNADLIITNHSLLLTDLKAEHRILPAYQRLVIDEAHHFSEVASKHLGFEVNQYVVNRLLQRLYKDAKNGFLVLLMNDLIHSQNPDYFPIANFIQNQIISLLPRIENDFQLYFSMIGDFVNKEASAQESGRKTLRVTDKIKERENWITIQEIANNLYIQLTDLSNLLEDVLRRLKHVEAEENMVIDLNGYLKEIKEMMFAFSEWNHLQNKEMVFWVETESRGKRLSSYLYAAPIEVGSYLKEFLFDRKESVIFTSATLSVNDSFNFSSKEFGFEADDKDLKKIKLDSPFHYKKQALVCIPSDFPNIQEVSEHIYIEHLAKYIADVAISLSGKVLVLFTSHSMLQRTHTLLKEILAPFQIKVLGHGIDSNSRSKLTTMFTENPNTILLGTSSFWEGVDVPGEALSALVIVRLPFTPPNHPINEAKTEKLKENHKNPFMELSVPQAIIRFKQGFGRLIRTKKDKGVVIIFDRRVVESRYGKSFIKSLPPVDIKYQPFTKIIAFIEDWMQKE